MNHRTFPQGGIHPPENKGTAGMPLVNVAPPDSVWIPLSQHIGSPATPVVKVGDRVKVGTMIADGQGMISAPVHSSVSGVVEKIDTVLDGSGFRKPAILIRREGDEWEDTIIRDFSLDTSIVCVPDDAMNRINAGGLVGKGGATFPTRVKYMVPPGKKVDTLLINGVECEPFLTSDHVLMLERPDEVIQGTMLLRWLLGVKLAVICIEENKPDAIALLSRRVKELGYAPPEDYLKDHLRGRGVPASENLDREGWIAVVGLHVKYPQGAEKQLIKAVLNREVPSGKLPLDVGVTVNNVATAHSAYKILKKHKPMVERIVTVAGPGVRKPGNYKVRIGTTVRELLTIADGLPVDGGKVILGGPMMGRTATHIDVPITKGTSGILVFPPELSLRGAPGPCIRCGACVSACPMGLEPYLLEKMVAVGKVQESAGKGLRDCVECGSCSFVCPSNRPLVDYIRQGKAQLAKAARKA